MAYRRGDLLVAANCGDGPADLVPPARWQLIFATARHHAREGAGLTLQQDHAVMLQLDPS